MIGQTAADDSTEFDDGGVLDPIDRTVAFGAAPDDALSSQLGQASGDARLFEPGRVREILDGAFSLHEQVEDSEPFGVAQRPETRSNELEGFVGQDGVLLGLLRHGHRVLTIFDSVNIRIYAYSNEEELCPPN